jgi:hypothetical protein
VVAVWTWLFPQLREVPESVGAGVDG